MEEEQTQEEQSPETQEVADKEKEVQNAQAQIALLEQQKQMVTDRLSETEDPDSKRGIQNVLNDINTRIAGAKGVLQKMVSAVDLVRKLPVVGKTVDKAIEKATEKVASAIDKFLEKYGNKKFEIVKSPKISVNIPLGIPIITLSASAQLSLSAELASKRTGATITSQATLAAIFTGQLGVAVGIKILGKLIGIEGGISVSASAIGKSVMTLSIAGTDLNATLNPADIEVIASAALYLKWSFGKPINWAVNKLVDKFVVRNLKGSSRNGSQLNYPLGSLELLIIKTPVYSLTFSITQARFSMNKTGTFTCQIHPKLKARFDALRKGFKK